MHELTPKWQCKIPKIKHRKEVIALKTLIIIEIFFQPENNVIYKCSFFFSFVSMWELKTFLWLTKIGEWNVNTFSWV